MKLWNVFAWIFLSVGLLGCSGTAPRIVELRWRLNIQFIPRRGTTLQDSNTLGYESLSLFIRPADEDGLDDLDSMYLLHNETDMFWALDASQWSSVTSAGIFWVGSNQFSSGYLGRLPRGEYWVQLYDKAGELTQRSFTLQEPNTHSLRNKVMVPPLGDELLLLLPEDVSFYAIVGYNVANEILFTDANYQSLISLKKLKIRNDELDNVQISFQFPDSNVMAILGPYRVPRVGSGGEQTSSFAEPPTEDLQEEFQEEPPIEPQQGQQPIDIYIPTIEEVEAQNAK